MDRERAVRFSLAGISLLVLASALVLASGIGLSAAPTAQAQQTNPGNSTGDSTVRGADDPPTTHSFSPPVRNTFSWHPTPYIKRVGPKENYVEKDNIEIVPYPRDWNSLLGGRLKYVEVWDIRGTPTENDDVLLENIPRWQISPRGMQVLDSGLEVTENFVSFRPPGKSVYLFTLENVKINGRKPPFRTEHLLKNPNVSFDVKLSRFGKGLIRATEHPTNFLPYIENYYFVGLENFSFSKLKDMFSRLKLLAGEFDYLPVYHHGKLLENIKCGLSLTNHEAHFGFSVSLEEKHKGLACASGKLGSHSISWTVSSSTDWSKGASSQLYIKDGEIGIGWYQDFSENVVDNWVTLSGGSVAWDSANEWLEVSDGGAYNDNIPFPDNMDATYYYDIKPGTYRGGVGIRADDAYDSNNVNSRVNNNGDVWGVRIVNGGNYVENLPSKTVSDIWYNVETVVSGATIKAKVEDNSFVSVTHENAYTGYNNLYLEARDSGGTFYIDNWWIVGGWSSGTWTSQVWDSGDTCIVKNIDYSAAVDSGENLLWNIEATDTGENTGWFQDEDNLIAQSELPSNIKGENFQISMKLETDNSTHSPSIQDYTLNVDPVPTIRSISVDNTLIDRDIDYSNSGANDNCAITATVRDNDGLADLYKGDNAPQFSIKDSTGTEVAHRPVAWENLVGYWDFQDNSSLDTWDKSAENNAGTMYNMTTDNYVDGKRGRALEFDGENDYVGVPHDDSLNTPTTFTWMGWLRIAGDTGAIQRVSYKQFSVTYLAVDPSYAEIWAELNYVTSDWTRTIWSVDVSTIDNEWHHFASVYDGSESRIYFDGNLKASKTMNEDIETSTAPLWIGQKGNDTEYFYGSLGSVRIYDRALSENEIKEIYRSGLRYRETGENTVEISTTYNPSDSLADSRLGGFDAKTNVVDNAGAFDNLENADLITVDDRTVENIAFENNYEHVLKVTADSARIVGSASVTSATLTDNNLGDYDMGSDLTVSYKTTQDGEVTVKATDGTIDGISSSKPYTFPNFRPSVESVSVDENLIDRDVDSPGFRAVDNATITYTVSDPDNRTNDLDSGASALLSVRDNCDENQIADDEIISSRTAVDENTVKVSKTYDPSDSLPGENLGLFDTKLDLTDHYGMENVSGFADLGHELFEVGDSTSSIYSVSESLVDRRDDGENFEAIDNTAIVMEFSSVGVKTKPENVSVSVRDNADTIDLSSQTVGQYENVDENTTRFRVNYNPSNDLPGDNLGAFDLRMDASWSLDSENEPFAGAGHGIITVDDRRTTIGHSPEQMLYSGDEVTVSGEASGFYEPVSLDNVVLKDSVDGTFRPSMDADSWSVSYTASQGVHEVTVEVLDEGSRLDGSNTLKFRVGSGKNQPSFNPTKQNLSIDLRVGLYRGKEPTKGGRIEFQPSSEFRPGDRVTVVAYLTANGVEISHADITGSWNGSSFPLRDKKANRFVGTFTIPKDTKSGSYLVSVDASARGLQSTASKTITVRKAKGINLVRLAKDYWFVIVIAVILLLIALE